MNEKASSVKVTRRFDASAERVYDAFLDPAWAGKFLFATPTGQIARCELEPRVGGKLVIVDRRGGEDVVHSGRYVELERPRRIVFTFSTRERSPETDKVSIEIAPQAGGSELTLSHEAPAKRGELERRTEQDWSGMLDVAAALVVDAAPTCGVGIAQHAGIPAKIAVMFEGLSETLALHLKMLVLDDREARQEAEVYRSLANNWHDLSKRVASLSDFMAAQRELPMAKHDPSAWSDQHFRAFEKFVAAQSQLLALLRAAAERDERMLASMKKPGDSEH